MDPNAALADLRNEVKHLTRLLDPPGFMTDQAREEVIDRADHVRDQFEALDEWLSKGGFPPDDWALHKSEEQWRIFCKDCADESSCSEAMGKAIVRAQIEAKTQHRYFLQRRTHAFGPWENVDAS